VLFWVGNKNVTGGILRSVKEAEAIGWDSQIVHIIDNKPVQA
jgi:isopentenyl phosphate kinase